MSLVTVLTPTYNRAQMLGSLYESLKKQSSQNFEWLIVDDGSTDNTGRVVDEMIRDAGFSIRYLRKTNGGKHTALNAGILEICTELTFIVDSDDTVLPEGIAQIEAAFEKYREEREIGIYSFLRTDTRKGIVLQMPEDELVGSYITERIRTPRPGDMAEVFRTEVLREFPFPEFPGEKFLSEDVVWIPMGKSYKTVFFNRPIYQFSYLPDGLTQNDKKHKFASPLGSMLRGKMLMSKECGILAKLRGAIIYGCYRREVRTPIPECVRLENMTDRLLVMLLHPVNGYYYRKWSADRDRYIDKLRKKHQ